MGRPPVHSRLWVLVLIGLVLTVVAVGAIAFTFGWGAANRVSNATRPHQVPAERFVIIPDFGQSGAAEMPDVRGLSKEDAEQALVDAGITASVSFRENEAAGPANMVIQQTPVFGSVNPATILLVLSKEAVMPNLVGTPVEDAIDRVQGLGVRVQQVKVYRPGAPIGQVVGTTPASGAPLPEVVTFEVSDTGTEAKLAELPTIDDDSVGALGPLTVGGVSYHSVIEFDPSWDDAEAIQWNVSGADVVLRAQLVFGEYSEPDERAVVDVVGDGKLLHSYDVSDAPTRLEVDLAGVDTLTIRVRNTVDPNNRDDAPYAANVSVLEPVLVGSFEQIQRLTR